METGIWVRRDREGGGESAVTKEFVAERLRDCYHDIALAMRSASRENPLTNGFADYYPEK